MDPEDIADLDEDVDLDFVEGVADRDESSEPDEPSRSEGPAISRRTLLAGLAAAAAIPLAASRLLQLNRPSRPPITGSLVGSSHEAGHRLRQPSLPAPDREEELPLIILGGGMAGLSAAWKLARSGYEDFGLFELDSHQGGTARGGRNAVSPYPWGAHYLPVPGPNARAVRELLLELGVIRGYGPDGHPDVDERYLCFAPQERLFIHGQWHFGLYPRAGATKQDLIELEAFESRMEQYRRWTDESGRPAFTVPINSSTRQAEIRDLDRLSMAEWLDQQGWRSDRLRWYVEYACRDDYGSTLEETSAWAGIFYYASRRTFDPEEEEGQLLTWPEGNGWIVDRLVKTLKGKLTTDSLALGVEATADGASADVMHLPTGITTRYRARQVVMALPAFVAKRICPSLPGEVLNSFSYAPWVVANVTVDRLPESRGAPICWDNVPHGSDSLGYVVATHQQLQARTGPSVLTWYLPLSGEPPAAARRRMLQTPWETWCRQILADLRRLHPDIDDIVSHIDVMLWGHGMVRPTPGFLWNEERLAAIDRPGPIRLAHSDLSGLPLFEEAQYRGILAAEGAMRDLGHGFTSSL